MRHRVVWLTGAVLMAVAAGGCWRAASEPVPARPLAEVVGPATESAPSFSPSPTPTATPRPTPTPTRSPAELMDAGTRALRNGRLVEAISAYGALHDLGADEATDAAALIGLAKAHARDESYAEAIDTLTVLISAYPSQEQAQDARFLLGDAHLAAQQPVSAAKAYEEYLRNGTVITPYVDTSLGDALQSAGIYTAARQAYRRAIEESPSRAFEADLRERTALSFVAQEQYAAAVDEYDAILQMARQPAYRAEIAYRAAETLLLGGDAETALGRHEEIVERYPTEDYAYLSLVRLVEAGSRVDDFQRGMVDYYGGAYGPAVQALYRYIWAFPETHSGDAHWYAGLSYQESGNLELAVKEYELLIETHPASRLRGEAWLELAELQADQGSIDDAVKTYRDLVDSAPDDSMAARALWDAGQLLEQEGRFAASGETYLDCQAAYPESDLAPAALFRAGLQFYQLGDLSRAAEIWERIPKAYDEKDYLSSALFWSGKVHLLKGETERAMETLERAAAVAPDAYYGIRAAELLGREGTLPSPEALSSRASGPSEESWLVASLERDGDEDPAELSPLLEADSRWQRGTKLLELDRFQEAKTELEALRRETYSNPLDQYQLALAYADVGLYRSSILAAWRLIGLAPITSTLEAPSEIVELAYPRYYVDLVLENARRSGLDPLLIYSLIRQESLFESLAMSTASAHGLMQVIPPTGAEIARDLGWPRSYSTDDLYRPHVSVRFGTHYLATQRDRFGGRIDVALAAYNGGPGNAQRWLERAGDDPDLFLERITFSETRLYLKRIAEHLAVYRALYADNE